MKISDKDSSTNIENGKKVVTLEEIAALSKSIQRRVNTKRRQAQKSEILTSTPVKNEMKRKYEVKKVTQKKKMQLKRR